ncbi:Smr/MutS family protein [Haliangium sp.]|uniref:Smr/MutS family protein n=1 Tax=Haliangium sp. TaxID=2663208 RepID=UPI003D1081B2
MSKKRRNRGGWRERAGECPGADDRAFVDAMRGVERLSGPERVPQRPSPPTRVQISAAPPPTLEIDGDSARAPGVSLRRMADLRGGRIEVELTIDLHGLRAEVAEDRVRKRISDAAAEGMRCVCVIHGRGLRSVGAPVLGEVVRRTLATPPTVRFVRAYCPARPEHGGLGATYVLLPVRARRAGSDRSRRDHE